MINVILVLLGLMPIGAWLALALSLDPVGLGRNIGLAILVAVTPLPIGGMLMIAGARLTRRARAGRIIATVGSAIVMVGAAGIALIWLIGYGACGGSASACTHEFIEGLLGLVYAPVHGALIAAIWRAPLPTRAT